MSTPQTSVPLPANPAFTVDATNFGFSTSKADNAPAIQAAHDWLIANKGGGTVLLPASTGYYTLLQPVWLDSSNVWVQGQTNTKLLCFFSKLTTGNGNYNTFTGTNAAFIVGEKRAGPAANVLITSGYRPDLYGILDSTVALAAGYRWGFRSNFDGYLTGQACQFTHSQPRAGGGLDSWGTTQTMTVDFAYQIFTQTSSNMVVIGGMGNATNQAGSPVLFSMRNDGTCFVYVGTQSGLYQTPTQHVYSFVVPSGGGNNTGLHRVAVQIYLGNVGTINAWADTLQCVVSGVSNPFTSGGNLFFAENQYEPFVCATSPTPNPNPKVQDYDMALYGFNMTTSLRYNTASGTLVRLDGLVVTDGNSFFPYMATSPNQDPGGIAYLSFRDNPNSTYTSSINGSGNCRFISVARNNNVGSDSSNVLISRFTQNNASLNNITISDLTIMNATNYGAQIEVANTVTTSIERVTLGPSGAYNILNMPYANNGPILVRDCVFRSSQDTACLFQNIDSHMDYNLFYGAGRSSLRYVGCKANVTNMVVSGVNTFNECVIKFFAGGYGGSAQFKGLSTDFGGNSPGRCVVYAERTNNANQSSIVCEDFDLTTASNAPLLFDLKQNATFSTQVTGPLVFQAKNIYGSGVNALARVDGPFIRGEIKDWYFVGGWPTNYVISTQPVGSPINLRVLDCTRVGPPRVGTFEVGSANFDVSAPVDGQYAEWRVIKRGTVNVSGGSPSFGGCNLLASTPFSAASYSYDQFGFSTVLFSGGIQGTWQDNILGALVSGIFGGVAYTPPITQYLGVYSTPGPIRYEPTSLHDFTHSLGYSRLSFVNNLTNFPAASGGVKYFGSSGVFNVTGPWFSSYQNLVCGLSFTDGNGTGNNSVSIALVTPQPVTTGTGPVVVPAISGFVMSQQPTNIGGYLTTYGWGKLMDCYFGAQSLGAPGTWYLGFSTSAANTSGVVTEPSGGTGYARTAIPNNTANWYNPCTLKDTQGGTVANSQAITIPTATGAWGTLRSMFLADSATIGGGNVWQIANLTQQITINNGQAPTVAAGAIQITLV